MSYSSDRGKNSLAPQFPPSGALSGSGGEYILPLFGYGTNRDRDKLDTGEPVSGTFLAADGSPLSGTVTLFRGGEPTSQGEINGSITLSGQVPLGVESGSSFESSPALSLVFEPDIVAVSFTESNYSRNPIGEVQYGSAKGKITDYKGDPVANDPVKGSGLTAITDQDGNYSLQAPGGTDVTLNAAGATQSVTLQGATTTTANFQYSRLRVRVINPENSPVRGAKVNINGKAYETDSEGFVEITLAVVGRYEIQVGSVERAVNITSSGQDKVETIGNSLSGVRVTASDSVTGSLILGTTVEVEGEGIRGNTGSDGEATSISSDEGEKGVVVGAGDKRYVTRVGSVELSRGEVVEIDIQLSEKSNNPTL